MPAAEASDELLSPAEDSLLAAEDSTLEEAWLLATEEEETSRLLTDDALDCATELSLDEDRALDEELDEDASSLLIELALDAEETTAELELLETAADEGVLETTEEATLEETALEELLLLEPDEPPPPQAARLNARLAVIKGISFIGYTLGLF